MLERVLATKKLKRAVQSGLTARLVRWDTTENEHIFNGRVGVACIDHLTTPGAKILDSTTFLAIHDNNDDALSVAKRDGVREFNFINGITRTVEQFLQGVGETEPDSPDEVPVMPKDAEAFNMGKTPHYLCKAPAPKSMPVDMSDSEDEDSKSKLKSVPIEDFDDILGEPQARSAPEPVSAPQASTTISKEAFKTPTAPSSVGASLQIKNEKDAFQPDNCYAKLDKIGLTSSAANQATYEHQNPSPRKAKLARSRIAYRSSTSRPLQGSSSSPASSSASLSGRIAPDPASLSWNPTPSTACSVDAAQTTEDWEKNVVRQGAAPVKLIDDQAAATTLPMCPPPGFPTGSNVAKQLSLQTQEAHRNAAARTGVLIDFGNNNDTQPGSGPTSNAQSPQLGNDQNVQPSRGSVQSMNGRIDERLKPTEDWPKLRPPTMQQRAGKKGKRNAPSSNKAGKRPEATLPMPDPVPPRVAWKEQDLIKTSTSRSALGAGSSNLTADIVQPTCHPDSTSTGYDEISPPLVPVLGLSKLVQAVSSSRNITGAKLEVQFGLLLTSHATTKHFFDGVRSVAKVEKMLTEAASDIRTDFLPRMTTSDADALFIFSLLGYGEVRSKVEYEVHLKTLNGEPRTICFDQQSPADFLVLDNNLTLGTMSMHYPMRIWDARATIIKPEVDIDSRETVRSFVESIRTTSPAPSFQAKVPSQAFSVEGVHVKRVFSKELDGIDCRVTEVQDLYLESVDSFELNFAACAYPKAMMAESQRLWWEFSLHAVEVDMMSASRLKGLVDELMTQIDGVGFNNEGPFVWQEVEEADAEIKEPSLWS